MEWRVGLRAWRAILFGRRTVCTTRLSVLRARCARHGCSATERKRPERRANCSVCRAPSSASRAPVLGHPSSELGAWCSAARRSDLRARPAERFARRSERRARCSGLPISALRAPTPAGRYRCSARGVRNAVHGARLPASRAMHPELRARTSDEGDASEGVEVRRGLQTAHSRNLGWENEPDPILLHSSALGSRSLCGNVR